MTPVTTSETIPATNLERSFVCFMFPPFFCSYLRARKQAVLPERRPACFTRALYQCPNGTWFELAIKQDACHSSEEAERVCHKQATLLAVDCKTKALRTFGLSSDDDPATDGRRIESPERGMKSPKRGESWRLG